MPNTSKLSQNIILVIFSLIAGFVLGAVYIKIRDVKTIAQIQKQDDLDSLHSQQNFTKINDVTLKSCEQGAVIEGNSSGAIINLSCILTNNKNVTVQFPIFLSDKKSSIVNLKSCTKMQSKTSNIDLLSCELDRKSVV